MMRPRGKRAMLAAAALFAAGGAVEAAPKAPSEPASAVARALPSGYRLVLTEQSGHGTVHVARYGKPGIEAGDAPLSVTSFRGGDDPASAPGDQQTTVRGHPAIL